MFLASNHTSSPSFSPCVFHLFLSNCLFIISLAMSIALVASSQLFHKPIKNSSSFGNSVCTVKSPFHECCSKLSLNGVHPIAMCFLSLYWNFAAASHSVQLCYMQVHSFRNYISMVKSSPNIQACLLWWPPFSQHILWQYCNHPDISSSMAEILLFNSVFHNRVTPVSVSTLKPPLRVIEVLLLKPWASPILSICI